ncbi:DUF2892 domain-containing protein [Paraglaciecola sp. L3A3]|uniref:YgaP family membrane protein n=1 Tax=Paraglaciecola sp. L3A3 TaxID=2686358 RepID=UPI00131E64AC|nr:DUF2892 domain-containing protein [Paraglaciecola sp. L3A3]
MKQNVGILDTALRSVIAIICLSIAAEGLLPQAGTIAMVVIGSLMWISSSFGLCFVYKILGIDTYPGAGHGITQYYPR